LWCVFSVHSVVFDFILFCFYRHHLIKLLLSFDYVSLSTKLHIFCNSLTLTLTNEWTEIDQIWKRHRAVIHAVHLCIIFWTNCCNLKRWWQRRR